MTFLELSTDLSGRYVSFRVNPLSFKEIVLLTNTKKEDYSRYGIKHINIFDFLMDDNFKCLYLSISNSLFNTSR